MRQAFVKLIEKLLGRGEVLDDIEHENNILIGYGQAVQAFVEVAKIKLVKPDIFEGKRVYAGDVASLELLERRSHVPAGAAKIEHAGMLRNDFECEGMRAGVFEFRGVMLKCDRCTIVAAIVENAEFLETSLDGGDHYVECIAHAVDAADFIAVISRDRQFADFPLGEKHQLNDDFGIEMEVVGIALEGDGAQGIDRIKPVAGVEFAEFANAAGDFGST